MRLIDADELERSVMSLGEDVVCNDCAYEFVNLINAQPTIEALENRNEPVSPIAMQDIFGTYLVCGNCGEKLENVLETETINGLPIKWQYCRKCGQAVKW